MAWFNYRKNNYHLCFK